MMSVVLAPALPALEQREGMARITDADLTFFFEKPIRRGRIPPWFKRRLKRVLGPNLFKHRKRSSPWYERAGSTTMPLEIIAFNSSSPSLHQQATQVCEVFAVEPLRPWVISKTDPLPDFLTEEQYTDLQPAYRNAFLDTLDKLLDQPTKLAEALRCRLHLDRAASGGWRRMRAIFVPYCIQEPDYFTPASYCLRTCRCSECAPRRQISMPVGACQCATCAAHWKSAQKRTRSQPK